ncbi:MAG: A24 family peptidase [Candidatus Diapherotrites archaeon]
MLPFVSLYFLFSFVGLVIATYTDLKERIVSNKLIFFLFCVGFVLKSFESFLASSLDPLFFALLGCLVGFSFSFLLYKFGVWAPGDVKLVAVLSFINPVNYGFLRSFFSSYFDFLSFPYFDSISLPVFGITLIVYSALSVFPLGLLMIFFEAFKRLSLLKSCFLESIKKFFYLFQLSFFVVCSKILLEYFFLFSFSDYFFVLIFYVFSFFVFIFVPVFFRFFLFVVSFLLAVFFVGFGFLEGAFFSFFVLFFVYFLFKIYFSFKDFAFVEEIGLDNVSEGMIPVDYIKIEKNSLFFVPKPSIKSVINDLINHKFNDAMSKLKPVGFFASPDNACGFSEEEAKVLRDFAFKSGLNQKIKVKKTMAFVPAITFAFIVLSFTGDFLWNVVF